MVDLYLVLLEPKKLFEYYSKPQPCASDEHLVLKAFKVAHTQTHPALFRNNLLCSDSTHAQVFFFLWMKLLTDWLIKLSLLPWRLTGYLRFSSITGMKDLPESSHIRSIHLAWQPSPAPVRKERGSLHLPGSTQRVICDIATKSSIKITHSTALNLLPISCNKRHFTFLVISLL